MKLSCVFAVLALSSVTLALPIRNREQVTSLLSTRSFFSNSNSNSNTNTNSNTNSNGAKTDASSSSGTGTSSSKLPSVSAVQAATMNFAKDANTVSASLNQLPSQSSSASIKSLATTAFNAESDEDAQRAVLAAAAGSAGSASNSKIVANTPTVLSGLKAIINSPNAATVKTNVATIQNARNPNILPSITQLSNAANKAVGSTMVQQSFAATGSGN